DEPEDRYPVFVEILPSWRGAGMAKPDLASLLDQASRSRNSSRCKTCLFVAELPPQDAATLEEAFADPEISTSVIVRALAGYGFSVSVSALYRHRRECR
ncbi:MAG TPA: hypothetical protein VIG24_08015, partial [Acidimicrobiia bacterium]